MLEAKQGEKFGENIAEHYSTGIQDEIWDRTELSADSMVQSLSLHLKPALIDLFLAAPIRMSIVLVAATALLITGSTMAGSPGCQEDNGYSDDSVQNTDEPLDPSEEIFPAKPQAQGGAIIGASNVPLNPAGAPGGGPDEAVQGSAGVSQNSGERPTMMDQGRKRTIDLNDMVSNATRLETRLRGYPTAAVVTELISRLRRISPSDARMLANPQRDSDNALVDNVLVANNLINNMLAASDEELFRRPPNVGALVLASNNIDNYIRTHERMTSEEDLSV
ncbi:unnamed protein product [Haemonchus placei]|uniref:Outer membrane protein n=1 Tax=Haemonchus placei TaxID=6290 RepID=A0A0N4X931_HAEPC|nr:unnamed protein product [Haemonchus placei]